MYTIDPPCVVERIEQAFLSCMDMRAARGRNWTTEDDAYCRSYSGFRTILGGEELPPLSVEAQQILICFEATKENGTPITSANYHVVLYTVSEDDWVADLLIVCDSPSAITRIYDCDTGELLQEIFPDGSVLLLYMPMLYDATDHVWRQGYNTIDVFEQLPPGSDPAALVNLVMEAQERRGLR